MWQWGDVRLGDHARDSRPHHTHGTMNTGIPYNTAHDCRYQLRLGLCSSNGDCFNHSKALHTACHLHAVFTNTHTATGNRHNHRLHAVASWRTQLRCEMPPSQHTILTLLVPRVRSSLFSGWHRAVPRSSEKTRTLCVHCRLHEP